MVSQFVSEDKTAAFPAFFEAESVLQLLFFDLTRVLTTQGENLMDLPISDLGLTY